MRANPIIFLDIDGVLNDHTSTESGYCGIDRELAGRLNRIVHETGAEIVISSAWRYMVHSGAMTLKGFTHLLCSHGVNAHGVVIGLTCTDEDLPGRGLQIRHWLNEHGGDRAYVVIDDEDVAGEITICGHPFVRTDRAMGLTDADVEAAIAILGRTADATEERVA